MKTIIITAVLGSALSGSVWAKLPALSDDAKAKAAEAAAKTAWAGKLDAFQLCKAQDRVAVYAVKSAKAAGKVATPSMDTPACADPGAFVYVPPGAVPGPAAAPAPAAAKKS
jgi:hypothetical protein